MSKCGRCGIGRLILTIAIGEEWECPNKLYWQCLICWHYEEANRNDRTTLEARKSGPWTLRKPPNDARTHEGEENGPQIA
jgi:hypothetical protein